MKLTYLLFACLFLCQTIVSQADFFVDLVHGIEEEEIRDTTDSDDYETLFDTFVETNEKRRRSFRPTRKPKIQQEIIEHPSRPKLQPEVVENIRQDDGCAEGHIPGAKFFDEHPDPQR